MRDQREFPIEHHWTTRVLLGTVMRVLVAVTALGCAATAAYLWGSGTGTDEVTHVHMQKEREAMRSAKSETRSHVTIPPLDADVPAKLETATFALG